LQKFTELTDITNTLPNTSHTTFHLMGTDFIQLSDSTFLLTICHPWKSEQEYCLFSLQYHRYNLDKPPAKILQMQSLERKGKIKRVTAYTNASQKPFGLTSL